MDFWCLQRMAAAAQGISKFRVSAWHVNKTIWIHFLIHSEFVTSSVLSKKYTSSFLVDNIKHVCVYFSLITDHCRKCCSHAWIQHWKLSIKQPIMFAYIGAPYVCLCPKIPRAFMMPTESRQFGHHLLSIFSLRQLLGNPSVSSCF